MRNLHHQPDAVSRLSTGILSCTVLELLNDFQGIVHRTVGLYSLDADDSADSTGIVFKGRAVQWILLFRILHDSAS